MQSLLYCVKNNHEIYQCQLLSSGRNKHVLYWKQIKSFILKFLITQNAFKWFLIIDLLLSEVKCCCQWWYLRQKRKHSILSVHPYNYQINMGHRPMPIFSVNWKMHTKKPMQICLLANLHANSSPNKDVYKAIVSYPSSCSRNVKEGYF